MKPPVEIDQRIIVQGIMTPVAVVKATTWIPNENRWEIVLDWGTHGLSKVYDTDENKVWYKYQAAN